MKSFLTGSRVYGTPLPHSDIDLVVLVEPDDLIFLEKAIVSADDLGSPGGAYYEDGRSLRFGVLNLLCVTDEKHFATWRQGTDELKAMAPVTRDAAIKHLADLRRRNKIGGW